MRAIKIATFGALLLMLSGCGGRPEPVKLDGDSVITINQELITLKRKGVPLDPFLKAHNWTYNIMLRKTKEGYFFENEDVVRIFYVAHNADRIILTGNEKAAREFKAYLLQNGVVAPIEISRLDMIDGSKSIVNALFFHQEKETL